MKKDKCLIRSYCRRVGALLPCRFREKKKILSDLRMELSGFLLQNPACGKDGLTDRFGTPEDTAAGYTNDMEPGELLRFLNVRRIIRNVCVVIAAAAILLWGGHRMYAYTVFKDHVTPVYDLSRFADQGEENQS